MANARCSPPLPASPITPVSAAQAASAAATSAVLETRRNPPPPEAPTPDGTILEMPPAMLPAAFADSPDVAGGEGSCWVVSSDPCFREEALPRECFFTTSVKYLAHGGGKRDRRRLFPLNLIILSVCVGVCCSADSLVPMVLLIVCVPLHLKNDSSHPSAVPDARPKAQGRKIHYATPRILLLRLHSYI